ncbi:unnamed protein product [Umbelopsis ramanniana]
MSYPMLTKQEEEALTTSAQATAQYVADLSELPAVQQQAQNDSQVPTSNVAQLDLPQDYQAHFSAAQAQAVAQAAAAAMTQANNGNYPVDFASATSASMDSQASQQQVSNDIYRKSLISEKVRAENRERKKRWREQNEDRNKDNDLRCRVNKRAIRLFGTGDSEHKRTWIEREFVKRQAKRKDKEIRKHAVNGAINNDGSVGGSPSADQLQSSAQANDLSQLQNSSYYNIGAGNMAPLSPNTTAKLLNSNLQEAIKAQQETSQLTSAQLLEKLLQQAPAPQLEGSQMQQFGNEQSTGESAAGNELGDVTPSVSESSSTPTTSTSQVANAPNGAPANQNGDYPMEAVLTLMQLNAGWRQ